MFAGEVERLHGDGRGLASRKAALVRELTGSADRIVGRLRLLLGEKQVHVAELQRADGFNRQESGGEAIFADAYLNAGPETGAYL